MPVYTTAVTSTGTNAGIWQSWNVTGTTASTLTLTNLTWTGWNEAYQETADQRAERERRAEQRRAEAAGQRRQHEAAVARAEELLTALLSDEQAVSRRDRGWFAVRGSRSGRTYRIHSTGTAGNVDRLGADGRREMTFCAHPPGVPAPDVHLAQMLSLATDEDGFLRVANSHAVRAEPVQAAA